MSKWKKKKKKKSQNSVIVRFPANDWAWNAFEGGEEGCF
jgi:hypothetical protein